MYFICVSDSLITSKDENANKEEEESPETCEEHPNSLGHLGMFYPEIFIQNHFKTLGTTEAVAEIKPMPGGSTDSASAEPNVPSTSQTSTTNNSEQSDSMQATPAVAPELGSQSMVDDAIAGQSVPTPVPLLPRSMGEPRLPVGSIYPPSQQHIYVIPNDLSRIDLSSFDWREPWD